MTPLMTPLKESWVQEMRQKAWKGVQAFLPKTGWELRFDEFGIEYAVYKGNGVRIELMWDGTVYFSGDDRVVCVKPDGSIDTVQIDPA